MTDVELNNKFVVKMQDTVFSGTLKEIDEYILSFGVDPERKYFVTHFWNENDEHTVELSSFPKLCSTVYERHELSASVLDFQQ